MADYSFDEAKAVALIEEMAKLHAEGMKSRMEFRLEMRDVLTEEQYTKLQQLRLERRQGKNGERRGKGRRGGGRLMGRRGGFNDDAFMYDHPEDEMID